MRLKWFLPHQFHLHRCHCESQKERWAWKTPYQKRGRMSQHICVDCWQIYRKKWSLPDHPEIEQTDKLNNKQYRVLFIYRISSLTDPLIRSSCRSTYKTDPDKDGTIMEQTDNHRAFRPKSCYNHFKTSFKSTHKSNWYGWLYVLLFQSVQFNLRGN